MPVTKLGEVAERAARAGVSASLMAELKAEKAQEAEAIRRKAALRRRRKKVEPKKPKVEEVAEDKSA